MEARLIQEFDLSKVTYFVHKKGRMEISDDPYRRDYVHYQDFCVLHETIATLRADASQAAEELHQMADNYNTMLDEAVRLGAELARERERHQWIDCKQALPPIAVPVWAWDGYDVVVRILTKRGWVATLGGVVYEVICWQPYGTPEPPALLEPQPAPVATPMEEKC